MSHKRSYIKVHFLIIMWFILVNLPMSVFAQDWGIGFRFGDPSGLTIKKKFSGKALEFSVGRTRSFHSNYFLVKDKEKWSKNDSYNAYEYIGYKRKHPISFQLHYQILKGDGDFHWYFGFGIQTKIRMFEYEYRYIENDSNNEWIYETSNDVIYYNIGADGVIGVEYKIPDIPISVFADACLFMEVHPEPFLFNFQGGLGFRYQF